MTEQDRQTTLNTFLKADRATQRRLALEAFREGNDLLRAIVKGLPQDQLVTMDWLLEAAVTSTDLRALVTTTHVGLYGAKPAYDTAGTHAASLIYDGLNYTDLDPDEELYDKLVTLDHGVQLACVAEMLSYPHPQSHKPLRTLEGVEPSSALWAMIYMIQEFDTFDEDSARVLATTAWSGKLLEDAIGVHHHAALVTDDAKTLQWLESFAREHVWSDEWEGRFRHEYAGTKEVRVPEEWMGETQLELRQPSTIELVPLATSSLMLEVWWQTIQKNEPHRLTKDLLTGFIANENTPEAIRDEAQIELDFHYAD